MNINDVLGDYSLTLVDTLDTLAVSLMTFYPFIIFCLFFVYFFFPILYETWKLS